MSIRFHAAAAALAVFFLPVGGEAAPATLPPVVVTANGIPTNDADATYASEVYGRAAIEASGASSLYDFLGQHTSLNVMPSFGNRNTPLIDMRGYGIGTGFQNVVVSVDGRRLNEIDQIPQFLGGISLSSVNSIEISKGSGSVLFGDGAMAGTIQIRTRAFEGVSLAGYAGSRNMQGLSASAGLSRELYDVSLFANRQDQGYSVDPDPTGHRDGGENRNEQAKLTLKPVAGLKLFVDGMNARVDTRYVNFLTPDQFNSNPAQNDGTIYTHQNYETRQIGVGAEYELSRGLVASYRHNEEDKNSALSFLGGPAPIIDYDYASDDLALKYLSTAFDLAVGVQRFDGVRSGDYGFGFGFSRTTKENLASYAQGIYRIGQLALSAGVRDEKVEYAYAPAGGAALQDEHDLHAWDLGANYRFSEQWTGFANLNSAYQAPDIDRFFACNFITLTCGFNGFIEPAKARTFNIGANFDSARHKLRMATFYSKLENEIFLDPLTFANTNIDKSHKYGLEIQERWQARDNLILSVLYAYTRAIIDEEGGALDNKELPGVPRHGVTLGILYKPWENTTLGLNHVWRDSSYAANDVANNFQHRQPIVSLTSVSLRQRFDKKFEGFVAIDNVFEQDNGLWIDDFSVYPVDFRRTLRVGLKADIL